MKRDFRVIFGIVQALLDAPHRARPINELPGVPSDEFQHATWLLHSRGLVLAENASTGFQVTALTWSGYDYADQHATYLNTRNRSPKETNQIPRGRMNTIAAPRINELPSAEVQIGIAVLEALAPMYPNLAFVRRAGLTVSVPEDIEAAYVAKHGEKGQWLIDVILGRKETIASVNVKTFMRLEDPETVDQILGKKC